MIIAIPSLFKFIWSKQSNQPLLEQIHEEVMSELFLQGVGYFLREGIIWRWLLRVESEHNASYSLPRPSIRIFPSLCKYHFKISERMKKYRREQELKKTTLCFDHFTAVSVRSELLTLSSDPSISLRSLCENHPGRFLLLIPLFQPQLHNCDHSLLISPPYIATIRWNVISVEE